ncbi:MAG: IS66 family transposase [Chitinophagaceae bacterium]|nr:IS66 family transposase [Chitinophagaceae bacterium]MCA6460723.1 IS66 family transposase [Chitinophagaceae bacterium]MCA6466363.1 IS66 family transposase [Chitinophagaceae bacterium]
MLESHEYQELKAAYQKLVLKNGQYDLLLKKKDDTIAQLTAEIDACKELIQQMRGQLLEQSEIITSLRETIRHKDEQLRDYDLLKHQFDQLKKLVYGRTSEKSVYVSPDQLKLDLEAEKIEACNINDGQRVASYTKSKAKNEDHPGRNQIPEHLRREYIDIHPANLPADAVLFDTEETEQLEYDPGRLFATVYRRFKYKRRKEDGSMEFFIGDLPVEKDKCLAAPSLRAHCIVEKYMFHMPLYRQIQKFAQDGVVIAKNTMTDWVNNDARSLTALYDAHRSSVLNAASQYMMADETRYRVLDSEKVKGRKSHIGQMWAYANPADKMAYFEYHHGRGKEYARRMLENFKGILHTDGYGVYEHFAKRPCITHANCNAHARRKFDESLATSKEKAEYVIAQYRELYAIEKHCREYDLSFDQRLEIRQSKSVPVFENLKDWCKDQLYHLRSDEKKSPIKTALSYFCSREAELGRFLHYGMVEIDTNLIERSIRPIALGRKNYMFAGSHDAAQNAAMIYSLLATCKLNDINPYNWLKNVLKLMPTYPASKIDDLLPQYWNSRIAL